MCRSSVHNLTYMCNSDHSQDTEHVYHLKKFPCVPFLFNPYLHQYATITLISVIKVTFACSQISYKWLLFPQQMILRFIHLVVFKWGSFFKDCIPFFD